MQESKIKNKKYWTIIVLSVVVLIAIILVGLCLVRGHKKNKHHEFKSYKLTQDFIDEFHGQYPLLDAGRIIYADKDLIVNIQPLREYLKAIPEQNKDWAEISIYFESLNTGASVTVNPDLKIWPASLSKLPIAMVAMKKVQNKEWSLDTKFKLENRDLGHDSFITEVGKEYTLEELLKAMLSQSDNASWKLLSRELTKDEILEIGEAVGLDEAFVSNAKVSAKDYTRLLRALHLAVFLNEDYSQELLSLLVGSEFKDFIKSGLNSDIKFAHKWGINEKLNVYADSGIVYIPNRPYIISVMVQSKYDQDQIDKAKVNALMKQIAQKTSQYMQNYD